MDQIWATCPMIKEREEFREWSNCSRRPARWRIKREKGFASGLIIPDDWPDRKKKREGFRELSNCSKRPVRWWKYRERFFFLRSGLIVMSDLPRWENTKKGSHCNGWPTQVKRERKMRARRRTQKDGRGIKGALKGGEGSKAHSKEWSRARRRARKEVRAQRRTRKRWGLEGALKREVGLGNTLPWMVKCSKALSKSEVGLGNALPWMVKGSKVHLKGNEGSKAHLKER